MFHPKFESNFNCPVYFANTSQPLGKIPPSIALSQHQGMVRGFYRLPGGNLKSDFAGHDHRAVQTSPCWPKCTEISPGSIFSWGKMINN